MQLRTRTWFLLSLLFFAGSIFFWLKGNDYQARKASAVHQSTNSLTFPVIDSKQPAGKGPSAHSGAFPYRLSNTTKTVSQLARSEEALLLRNALIDAAGKPLEIPAHLRAHGDPGAYIVQAKGPPSQSFREFLQRAHAEIVSYIPNNAYLVKASPEALADLRSGPEVRTVLPFEPYYKIDQRLLGAAVEGASLPEGTVLRVLLYPGDEQLGQTGMESLGGEVIGKERSPFGTQYLVRVQPDSLVSLAQLATVQEIEPFRQRIPANDLTRVQVGISTNTTTTANYLNLSGTNTYININDSGVDNTHPDFTAANIYSPVPSALTDTNGHGTHVAGILAGSGKQSKTVQTTPDGSVTNANFRGMAPAAKLVVLPIDFSPEVEHHVTDIYLQETAALISQDKYNRTNETLISNNSWNYSDVASYDTSAARYDAAVRDALPERAGSQPILYVFSAGNNGGGDDDGLGGQPDSILSPGTAKNVITVGALEHLRFITNQIVTTNIMTGISNMTVTNYTTNMPFFAVTDNDNEVAFYSSRGNVGIGTEGDFGRFKPDVVAPGTFMISTKATNWTLASQIDTNSDLYPLLSNLDKNLGPYYRYDSGTTFAAPVVSGMLALMQEFFEQHVQGRKRSLSPALMKAMVINGAHSVNQEYDLQVQNSVNHQGWGFANIQQIIPPIMATGAETSWPIQLIEQSPTNALATGQSKTWNLTLSTNATAPLRITLVWTDPPGNPNAAIKLVNDLDLVVTNLETGTVFYGNNIPPGSDFNSASDTNAPPANDFVNNVENVFITDPQSIGRKFAVSVVGRRVNVNAIVDYLSATGKTNDVVQDFALVIATGNINLTNAITLTPAPVDGQFNASFTTTITNGLPLVNQRAGANASLVVTNGITNQWSFYVFTNTFNTNTSDLFSLTNGTNVAFVTYLPPNLSRQRNFEADIDMYVSNDARLLNLDPNALALAKRSVGRTGSELVVYSNAAPGEVFYVAIKSEDQQGAEFGFITISTDQPFETTSGNNKLLRIFPGNRFVPDGSANLPSAAIGIAVGITPALVQRATARVTFNHEDLGDLVGTLFHRSHFAVLNNHTLNNGHFTGTNTFLYDDSSSLLPGEQHTDGPGSLNSFVSDSSAGPWIFQLVDNTPTHVGRLQDMVITIQPFVGGDLAKSGSKVFTLTTDPICFFLDVPPNATNLIVTLVATSGSLSGVEMLIKKDLVPSPTDNDKSATETPLGVIRLQVGQGDKPPLSWGRYYICVDKTSTNNTTPVSFTVNSDLQLAFAPDLFGSFGSQNSQALVEDTVTTNDTFTVLADRLVANVDVGVRIDHPRISDLVLHLVSPQGTRILLAENRGGTTTNGYGSGSGDNLAYTVFTEDTNLATIPIKFAVPPFGSTNTTLNFVLTNSFDSAAGGVYFPGDKPDGWTIVDNDVTIAAQTGFAADGPNFAALCDSGIKRTIATVPGKEYVLRFRSRSPIRLSGTGLDDNGRVLAAGALDPHYLNVSALFNLALTKPNYVVSPPLPTGWLADSTTSEWISLPPTVLTLSNGVPDVVISQPPGVYIYRTLFDLCGFAPASVRITGKWAADDSGFDIRVNGQASGLTTSGPGNLSSSFTLAAGVFTFNEAVNSIDFVTTNATASPTGLRTELSISATPLSTITNLNPLGIVRLTGIASNIFGGTTYWTNNAITFVATTNATVLEIDAAQSGMWIDGVSVRESGNKYFLPEEDLSILKGEPADGEWALEIWDSRIGAAVTNSPAHLVSWTVNLDFALPQIPAIILTNGIPYKGTIATNQIQYFIVETCPGTTVAKNVLSGLSSGLELLGNRNGIPREDSERDDFVPILNNEKGTGTNDTATLTLTTTTPPAAPLIAGKRYYLAVRNADTLATNTFTLTSTLDVSGCSSGLSSLTVARLSSSAPVTSSVQPSGQANYVFSVPAGSASAVFQLNGLSGNADLLLRRGSPPTLQTYDRISANFGAQAEQIVITTNASMTSLAGDWYVAVVNNDSFSVNYTLRAATFASIGIVNLQLRPPVFNRNTGILTLTWSSLAGASYAVEASSDLVTWSTVMDVSATGASASVNLTTDPASQSQFYRIRAEP